MTWPSINQILITCFIVIYILAQIQGSEFSVPSSRASSEKSSNLTFTIQSFAMKSAQTANSYQFTENYPEKFRVNTADVERTIRNLGGHSNSGGSRFGGLNYQEYNFRSGSGYKTTSSINGGIISSANIGSAKSASIDNPEDFDAGQSSFEGYQTPIGGRCYSPDLSMDVPSFSGTCQRLSHCPSLQPLVKQLQYQNSIRFLVFIGCRFSDGEVFFCCPPYTFGSSNTPFLGQSPIRDIPSVSSVPASIPGPDECGNITINTPRIIGGDSVTEGEFPWLAALGFPIGFTGFQISCTGSLITKRHVLSAAHCIQAAAIEIPTHVRLNEVDLAMNTSRPHQEFIITEYHAPKYHSAIAINDVLIVTLHADAVFNDYVQPGCLPFPDPTAPKPGDTVTAVGYGRLRDNPPNDLVLAQFPQKLDTPVLSNFDCQNVYYSGFSSIYVIDDRVFCDGGVGGEGTCIGDSGGPLHLLDVTTNKLLIVGVTNAGQGCGSSQFPSINLRVGAFLPWIRKVTGN